MYKFFVILSFLICSCSTTSNYYSFDNALAAGTERIQNELPKGAKVAILDFKSDNENLSSYIIEEMYDKLINFDKLAIMERSRTNTIAIEVGYQLSGEVDDREIVRIGHQLGADYVVTGQITFSGEAYRLRIFAIDIEKGRRIASSSLNINRNDKQINYLITTQTTTNVYESQNIVNNNENVLLTAIQNLLENIPRNSRVIISGIIGTNDLSQDYIQEKIFDQLLLRFPNNEISLIDYKQRSNMVKEIEFQINRNNMIAIGRMVGANIIITGGIFGSRDTRRITFRVLNVETRQIVASSCVLFNQNNTDFINDVEALYQRVYNNLYNNIKSEAIIGINNTIGTNRNADFVHDIIENNLINNSRYKIVTRSNYDLDLIKKELDFQWAGYVSDETSVRLGREMGSQYIINIEFVNNKIRINIIDVEMGRIFRQELL